MKRVRVRTGRTVSWYNEREREKIVENRLIKLVRRGNEGSGENFGGRVWVMRLEDQNRIILRSK